MESNNTDSGLTKEKIKGKVENWLAPILFLTTFTGIIVGAVGSVTGFLNIFKTELYLVVTVVYIATISLAFRVKWTAIVGDQITVKKLRLYIILIASFVYLFTMGMTYYEYKLKKKGPAEQPDIRLSLDYLLFGSTAYAQTPAEQPFKIVMFYLNEDLCSFSEERSLLFAQPGTKRYRTFSYDLDVQAAFKKGQCTGVTGNRPIDNVLPLIKEHLKQDNRESLIKYIESAADLSRVIMERGDIFNKIMFTSSYLQEMEDKSRSDFEKVKEWLLSCVGIQNPVVTVVVGSSSEKPIILNKVVYQVLDVGSVLGGVSGPLYPEITYDHIIKHEKGDQDFALRPPFMIGPRDTASFNLRIISGSEGHGLGWLLRIRVEDTEGNYSVTEPFQLFMQK